MPVRGACALVAAAAALATALAACSPQARQDAGGVPQVNGEADRAKCTRDRILVTGKSRELIVALCGQPERIIRDRYTNQVTYLYCAGSKEIACREPGTYYYLNFRNGELVSWRLF